MLEYAQDPAKVRFDTEHTYGVLINASHAHKIRSYYIQNEARLDEFGIDKPYDFNSPQNWAARIAAYDGQHNDGSGMYFAVFERSTETILGTMSITDVRRGAIESCRFGFTWGTARPEYMQQALDGIHDYMFNTVDIHRAELDWDIDNKTIPGMAEKFGFEKIGVMKSFIKSGGVWRDHVLAQKVNPNH